MRKGKRIFSGFLSMVLCTSMALPVSAGEWNALQPAAREARNAEVAVTDSKISVGNGYLEREYDISGGKISTGAVKNSRIGSTLVPQEGSEDFVIHTIRPGDEEENPDTGKIPQMALDKSNWAISVKNAEGTAFPEASAKKLIDGDLGTYPDEYTISGNPFTIEIDFGEKKQIRSMSVDKRPGYGDAAYGKNGTMGQFELYVSEDGENYTKACAGEFTEEAYQLHEEGGLYNVGNTVYANVNASGSVQYVRLVQKSCSMGSSQELTSAEIGFYEDAYSGPVWTEEMPPEKALDKSNWAISVKNAEGTAFPEASAKLLVDGDLDTYPNEYTISGNPFTIEIDFGEKKQIRSMSVDKRPGYGDAAYGTNGTMGQFDLYVSEDGETYTKACAGEFTKEAYRLHEEGELYNVGKTVYANITAPASVQYVRLVQKSCSIGTSEELTSAEIGFYEDAYFGYDWTVYDPEIPVTETFPQKELDRSGWGVSIKNAAGTAFPDTQAEKLIDGDLNTYPDYYQVSGYPITVDIDLGEKKQIRSMSVDKRPGYSDSNYGKNGTMGKFELLVSEDGENYTKACEGEFTEEAYQLHQEGNLFNVGKTVYMNVNAPGSVRYVRLVQKSCALGAAEEFSSAELKFYEDTYSGYDWSVEEEPVVETGEIRSSDLTYENAEQADIEGGKKLTIHYAPYEVDGVSWDIDQVVVVKNDEHYMRSFLEITVSDPEKATIDYIDTDRFVLTGQEEGIWCHPEDSKISSMWIGKHELMLGQPIYVEGLFMGCEFPANDNIITDNAIQIRYYSGKNFTKLKEDNQLTTDGKFVTWQNVIGAAEGTDTSVVQTAFFSYIEDIATPTEFRKQYNSWYDNMMNITDESIAASFYGAEEGLSSNGVEPLDCYVVDDGWNTYYYNEPDSGLPAMSPGSTQGTTPNQTGFWEFNAKFPNELYTSASLSEKLQSTFGLWVGPQGGYNYFGQFSQFLEYKGTGEVQSNSALGNVICTGSRKYLKNFEAMALDYQERFDIDYWKWDGFASRPCNNASHDHMTGGTNNMYFTSDMWEAWTDLFDHVRAQRAAEGKGLFINATCYVNLSPWLLQWVNTIWVQDSGDTGQLGTGERHQQKIYYRDQVYYQLYKQNQVQFPLKNIYNHDPIYGVSDGSDATTEVFREFLFANAVRGTAFWELYYSPSIMDEDKWMVTADAIAWAEENHEVLKNAKLFGNQPKEGVYGYSCWNGNQGIVSFTNPLDTEQTYELAVTDVAGADKSLSNAAGIQVHPYKTEALDAVSYGDTITVTLQPHQTIIQQYGLQDKTAPALTSAKITGEDEVTLKFNERIGSGSYTVNGKKADAELQADYRTVILKSDSPLTDGASVAAEVTDVMGNTSNETAQLSYHKNNIIGEIDRLGELERSYDALSDINWLKDVKQQYTAEAAGTIQGTTDFTISTGVKTTAKGVNLVSVGDDVSVSVNNEGFAEFKVKNVTLSSEETVTTVTQKAHGLFGSDEYVPTAVETGTAGMVNDGKEHTITAVREVNGLLKLYVDGALSASVYDKAHLNENVSGGEVKIADNGFSGDIAEVTILNYALGYSEVPGIVEPEAIVSPSHDGWTATACSECSNATGDANAMAALDGNLNSWWHTNYSGGDTCGTNSHWIEISFNKAETFSKFLYTGRGSGSNGSVKEFKLELKDGDGNYTTIIEKGSFSTTEAANVVELGQEYTAYGLRMTILSTQNGRNFGAAVEMDIASDVTLLAGQELNAAKEALLETAKDFNPDDYTAETAQPVTELLEEIANTYRATSITMEQLGTKLDTAMKNLVRKDGSETPLTPAELEAAKAELLDKVKGLDLTEYTDETAAKVTAAVEAINAVSSATSTQMADLGAKLDEAIKALVKKDEGETPLTPAELEAAKAELLDKVKGLNLTEYTDETAAKVTAAVKAINDVSSATSAQMADLGAKLDEAIKALVKKDEGETPLTPAELAAAKTKLLENVKDLDLTEYTDETAAEVKKAVDAINDISSATSAQMADLGAKLDEAIKALVKKDEGETLLTPAELAAAKAELLDKVKGLNLTEYTDETAAKVTAAVNAINAISSATSAQMADLGAKLDAAIKALVKKGSDVKPCTHVEKTSVVPATTEADGKITVTCQLCGVQLKEEVINKIQSVELVKNSYAYNGKVRQPAAVVKDSKGNEIASSNYTVTYNQAAKNVGKYTATITFAGNYSGTAVKDFTIIPKATKFTQVKAKSKAISVKWKKQTKEVTGYEIQCSQKKNFAKAKTVTFKYKKSVKAATLKKKLKGNQKYYVRIRTYKNVSKTKYYSAWSAVKQVKTKK